MSLIGPHLRTVLLILLLPVVIVGSAITQSIRLVLVVVSLSYLSVTGCSLWIQSRNTERTPLVQRDFVLRRGGAWALISLTLGVTLLITQDFLHGFLTLSVVYVAGAFDQAALRMDGPAA